MEKYNLLFSFLLLLLCPCVAISLAPKLVGNTPVYNELKKSATQGDAYAQGELGSRYRTGKGHRTK